MKRWRLLVIDQDPAIYRYLRRCLSTRGYEIVSAHVGNVISRIGECQPDLILLDVILDQCGELPLPTIRSVSRAPVLCLLPYSSARAVVSALDAGAEDCIAKPFRIDEVAARIRKILRRDMLQRGEIPSLSSSTLRIDLVSRRIFKANQALTLSPRQFELLHLLIKGDGRVLSASELMEAIRKPGHPGDIGLLRQAIQRLRWKIELDPRRPEHILTVARVGYRFVLHSPDALSAEQSGPEASLKR